MLSHEFSAELGPDDRLRPRVMLSGALAVIAGIALVIHMPLGILPRLAFVMALLVGGGAELWALSRGSARVARIGLNQLGDVWVIDAVGQKRPVRLLRGSMVLSRHAWLRIRFENGRKYAELVSGNAVQDEQWHRFQLIWKQARQIIGRAGRS